MALAPKRVKRISTAQAERKFDIGGNIDGDISRPSSTNNAAFTMKFLKVGRVAIITRGRCNAVGKN